jgi:hypothetical protein
MISGISLQYSLPCAVKGVIFYNTRRQEPREVEVVSVFAPGIDRRIAFIKSSGGIHLQLVNIFLSYAKLLKQGIGVLNMACGSVA